MSDHSKTANSDPVVALSGNSKTRPKRIKYVSLALLLAVVVVVVAIALRSFVFVPRFQKITYNNDQGTSFSLKFYSRHYVSKDFTTDNPAQALHNGQKAYANAAAGLASKVTVDSRYPIWLSITTNPLTPAVRELYEMSRTIPCAPEPTVFTVYDPLIKQSLPVCKFSLLAGRPAYSASFIYKQNLYFVNITQVASKSQLTDPNYSLSTGLSSYRTDLTTILSSIKPAD